MCLEGSSLRTFVHCCVPENFHYFVIDISSKKLLSMVVRTSDGFNTNDYFFGSVEVTAANADGANNMTGKNHSVAALLKKDCPYLVVLKCICHSFALCASYACEFLPSSVESTARDVYNYSPKRIGEFQDILCLLGDKPVKLLQPSKTHWLSLEMVVKRLIDAVR